MPDGNFIVNVPLDPSGAARMRSSGSLQKSVAQYAAEKA